MHRRVSSHAPLRREAALAPPRQSRWTSSTCSCRCPAGVGCPERIQCPCVAVFPGGTTRPHFILHESSLTVPDSPASPTPPHRDTKIRLGLGCRPVMRRRSVPQGRLYGRCWYRRAWDRLEGQRRSRLPPAGVRHWSSIPSRCSSCRLTSTCSSWSRWARPIAWLRPPGTI